MSTWAFVSLPYFALILGLAGLLPGIPGASRLRAAGTAVAGALLAVAGGLTDVFWLGSVVLPPTVLLVAYRASGFLWRGPMFGVEAGLADADRALGIPRLTRGTPRWLAEYLEFAYAGVYPLIPLALVLHLAFSASPDADRFWTVVLVTDYICFGMLPFIQTRPPRNLEAQPPWRAALRRLNLGIVDRASTGMNTVPSGHAAEAMAAALLVFDAPTAVVVPMFIFALSISAGAVLGRYHFAIDAIAGWIVAVVVWAVVA